MSQKAEVGWKKLIEVIELTNTSSLQVNDAIITAFVKNSQELTAVVRRRVSKLSSVNVVSDFLTCIFSYCSPVSNWLAIAISNSLSLSWETTTPCQLIRFASISTPCKLRLCFDLELDVLYLICSFSQRRIWPEACHSDSTSLEKRTQFGYSSSWLALVVQVGFSSLFRIRSSAVGGHFPGVSVLAAIRNSTNESV